MHTPKHTDSCHTHTSTHTSTYSHMQSHIHTHSVTLTHIHTLALTLRHIHSRVYTRSHMYSYTHSIYLHAHAVTHTHTRALTLTLTQSHTRTPSRVSIALMMKILSLQEPAPHTRWPLLPALQSPSPSAPATPASFLHPSQVCTGCTLSCSTHTHLLPSPPATKHSSAPALIPVRSPPIG